MMFSYTTGSAAKTAAILMVATTAVLASGGFVSVYAQNDTQDEIDERLLACADLSDTAERTACFDDVVQGLKQGTESSEVADAESTADSENVTSVEALPKPAVDDFGLEDQIARADKKEKNQKESEAGSVHAMIVRSAKSGDFHFVVELDNGQVWEETDASRRMGLPRVGMPVEISRGVFGSYRMKIGDDNRMARVRRLK